MDFLLLRPAHLAAATAAKTHSRRAAAAASAASASASVSLATSVTSRPSSLVSAQCATHVHLPLIHHQHQQRRSFRFTPSVRRAGNRNEDTDPRAAGAAAAAANGIGIETETETDAAGRQQHQQQKLQQSTPKTKQKKRMRYRIAAAASAKTSGVSLDKNVYPFLPHYHDAIGVQDISSMDPARRRRSRPDSGEDAFFVSKVGIGRGIDSALRHDRDGALLEGTFSSAVPRRSTDGDGNGDEDEGGTIAFGVADGVGGWANSGVDPADFSHALCTYMADSAMLWKDEPGRLTGRKLIQLGYEKSLRDRAIFAGGSTASLGVAWDNGELELTNLGDSGSMLFRNGAIHHYSPPQTHDFNTPYQLTIMPPRARSQSAIFGGRPFDDLPNAADVTTWDMQHGDVLLLATDGVFDNLFRNDLLRVVASSMFTSGAWEMDGENGAKVARDLMGVTRPGGLDIVPFLRKEWKSRQQKQKQNQDQDQDQSRSQSQPRDKSEGERKEIEAEDPLAGIEPLLKPSLQSILALSVVVQAKVASLNMKRDGPFAKEAQRFRPGEHWRGGKVDDTTALIVVAVEEGREL